MTISNPFAIPAEGFLLLATRLSEAAAGNVPYTGVGFTPRAIIVHYFLDSAGFGWGLGDTALSNFTIGLRAGSWAFSNALLIDSTAATTNYQRATLVSMDADGFTLAWTKSATGPGDTSLAFLCFGS